MKNHSIDGGVQKVQGRFNTFNWFKSSKNVQKFKKSSRVQRSSISVQFFK